VLGGLYTLSSAVGMSAFGAITAFGLIIAGTMFVIGRWHRHNGIHHKAELDRLLAIAKSDKH
jgi:MFS transporter, LPLT family, lysophospholipid transporter